MPADTSRSIGAVTEVLTRQLRARTNVASVTQGRPEPPASETTGKLNLFLYEAVPDGPLRSHALDGRPAPVWLTLRYLVTAFTGGSSDSAGAHLLLGQAIRALQSMAYLTLPSDLSDPDAAALRANPEPLKLTFVPVGSELLGRLMQGTDEKYRCSIAVEIRPVMIASSVTSEAALLVGVPQRPPPADRKPGVVIAVAPIAAPVFKTVTPTIFEAGQTLVLDGVGFSEGDVARLAGVQQWITREGEHLVTSFAATDLATQTAAGALPLTVARLVESTTGSTTLPPRYRSSEPIMVRLVPTLSSATIAIRAPDPMGTAGNLVLDIDLSGQLLGRPVDDTIVSLWANGRTIANSDELSELAGDPQTARRVKIHNVPPSLERYHVIVRVNGSQAQLSPTIGVPP